MSSFSASERLLILLLGILLGVLGPSAAPIQADTVPHRYFTSFDGLPSENITALAQTPEGRLWIGTETGLAVYDGHEIRSVALPDSIGTTYISAIQALPDGSVWITPSTGEAVKVQNEGVVKTVALGDRIVQQIVRRGEVLLFVTRRAIWRLRPGQSTATRQLFQYDIRPKELGTTEGAGAGVFNAARGPDGAIWVLDGHLGPGRLHRDGSVSFVEASPQPRSRFWYDIQFSTDGTALVLQGERVHRMDPATGTLEVVMDELGDLTYLSVQGTEAFVTRGQTLLRYNVTEDTWDPPLGPKQGLPESMPTRVLRGQENGLWIGTREGLLFLMEPGARHVEGIGEFPLHNVAQFLSNGSGLWTRTYGSGLVQLRPNRRQVVPNGLVGWRQPIYSRDGRPHALASETRAWYTRDERGEWRRVKDTGGAVEGVIPENGIGYFLHEDGLYRHRADDPGATTQIDQWASDRTYRHDVALLPDGDVLHRSGGAFLRRRPSDGAVVDTIATLQQRPNRGFRQVAVDQAGRIWCAVPYGGIIQVNPDADAQRMILREHRMWSLETVGDSLLIASSRKQGAYLVEARSGSVRRQLTQADGLRSNTVMATHLARDTLFLGHDNGVTRLPTDRLFDVPSSPRSLITGLEVDLESRPLSSDSVLASTERNVGINYAAPSLVNADQVQYEVRLLPQDEDWNKTTHRFTRYTNLEPGTYTFEVRARVGPQPPGASAAYTFTIPPHFYETSWFRFFVAVLLFYVALGAYRWRTYQLRRRQERLQTAVDERTQELKQRTQELAAAKQKTEQQAERLAELDEAKNRFFAHISHEFRTPLSLILSPLQDAVQKATGETITFSGRQVHRMVDSAKRLRRLIDRLLDLATLEAGRMELDRRPGDIASVVERAAEAFRSKAEQKNLTLRVDGPEGRIETKFDPEKVETIVSNLVGNAVKFTPRMGTVVVQIERARRNDVVDAPEGEALSGAVEIAVSDTGPGIASEEQENLFQRFEQVDNSATREHEGTGLGLALTQQLVDLHGGAITVESVVGEGSTFTVYLPVVPVADLDSFSPSAEAPPEGEKTVNESGKQVHTPAAVDSSGDEDGPTILVVEDNGEMRAYLREILSSRWNVLDAQDGEEGWALVQEEQPDLVLSDVMMPGISGVELCERIKGDEALRVTPVLLVTARAGDNAAVQGLSAGADDYVTKPFDVEELRQRIENHLAARAHLEDQYREQVELTGLGTEIEEEVVPFMEEVIEAADDRLSDPDLTVGDLASALALSRRQFTRKVKQSIGEPPGELIHQLRLKRAKALLTGGAESVAEVAYAVGYRSASAFTQAFRREVGKTPTAYVEEHGDE